MSVDYRLLPFFEASWQLVKAARVAVPVEAHGTAKPHDQLLGRDARRARDRISPAAAQAIQRWLEDDR